MADYDYEPMPSVTARIVKELLAIEQGLLPEKERVIRPKPGALPKKEKKPPTSDVVEQKVSKLLKEHPFGMTLEYLETEYEKDAKFKLDMTEDQTWRRLIWSPPEFYQMEGLPSLIFGAELEGVIPRVNYLATTLFHRIQCLVGKSPSLILDVRTIRERMKSNFGRSFTPKSWGFKNYAMLYQFLEENCESCHPNVALIKVENRRKCFIGCNPIVGEIYDTINPYGLRRRIKIQERHLDNPLKHLMSENANLNN
jgi:hypothetical protein